jgi:glycerate dehydrogenase
MLRSARIIGKIILTEDQKSFLIENNIGFIADANPEHAGDELDVIERIGDAEAIIVNISTPITESILNACPNLRFIQSWSAGTDHIDLIQCEERGIIVKANSTYSIEAIAQKTIGLILLTANRLLEANLSAKAGEWRYADFQGIELTGKTLCIVGYGNIGKRVGELAAAFGMHILGINSTTSKKEMKHFFSQSDVISVHCPLISSTNSLLNAEMFDAFKSGCLLINTARGGVINEPDLLMALDSGVIRAAALDVLSKEPPSPDCPLLHHDKVFVTPHVAWHTQESVHRLTESCINSIVNFFN